MTKHSHSKKVSHKLTLCISHGLLTPPPSGFCSGMEVCYLFLLFFFCTWKGIFHETMIKTLLFIRPDYIMNALIKYIEHWIEHCI